MTTQNRTNAVLHLTTDIGQIILENGGETYRAQETMNRLAKAYGMTEWSHFVVPTGIMTTLSDSEGNTLSLNRVITHRTINLEKVAAANVIARRLETSPTDPESARTELRQLESVTGLPLPASLFFSGVIASFFTLVFGGHGREFMVSFITGAAIRGLHTLCCRAGFGDFFANAVGGLTAALLALLSVSIGFTASHDAIIIGAIMLLVPGLSLVNAIRDTIAGDILSGTSRAVEAFVLSLGIALGAGVMLKIWFFFHGGIHP